MVNRLPSFPSPSIARAVPGQAPASPHPRPKISDPGTRPFFQGLPWYLAGAALIRVRALLSRKI
jgi:hypothetical protein